MQPGTLSNHTVEVFSKCHGRGGLHLALVVLKLDTRSSAPATTEESIIFFTVLSGRPCFPVCSHAFMLLAFRLLTLLEPVPESHTRAAKGSGQVQFLASQPLEQKNANRRGVKWV